MRTKLFIITLFFGVVSTLHVFSQTGLSNDHTSSRRFSSFNDPSYLMYKNGIGNIEKLKYEVSFAPSIIFQTTKIPGLGFEFSPHIILRSYEQFSHPVRTPSYMPKGTLYYNFRKTNEFKPDKYLFITYGHHSNGQDGPLFQSDSVTINIVDGSFSSNYFLGGVILSNPEKNVFNPVSYLKFSSKYYLITDLAVKELYGRLRFFADLESTINLSKNKEGVVGGTKSKSKLISSLHLGWIALEMYDAKPIDIKRLIFSYTLSYQPSFVPELALFARFYYGQDYYNINFERTLNVFQFGVAISDLHF
jgi:hypothetical protein